jgi:hypothetical protein
VNAIVVHLSAVMPAFPEGKFGEVGAAILIGIVLAAGLAGLSLWTLRAYGRRGLLVVCAVVEVALFISVIVLRNGAWRKEVPILTLMTAAMLPALAVTWTIWTTNGRGFTMAKQISLATLAGVLLILPSGMIGVLLSGVSELFR